MKTVGGGRLSSLESDAGIASRARAGHRIILEGSGLSTATQRSVVAEIVRPQFILIDHQTLAREGLARMISECFRNARVQEFGSLEDFGNHFGCEQQSCVLLVAMRPSLDMETALSVIESGRGNKNCTVVLLADQWSLSDVKRAFGRGVSGCVPLSEPFKRVAAALQLVMAGGRYIPDQVLLDDVGSAPITPNTVTLAADYHDPRFTPQELRVLSAVQEGKSNKRIAIDLDLCESTVKVHVRHIMRKLGVTNRTQVALCVKSRATSPATIISAVPQLT